MPSGGSMGGTGELEDDLEDYDDNDSGQMPFRNAIIASTSSVAY